MPAGRTDKSTPEKRHKKDWYRTDIKLVQALASFTVHTTFAKAARPVMRVLDIGADDFRWGRKFSQRIHSLNPRRKIKTWGIEYRDLPQPSDCDYWVCPQDVMTWISDTKFDLIVSNPPFADKIKSPPLVDRIIYRALTEWLAPNGMAVFMAPTDITHSKKRWIQESGAKIALLDDCPINSKIEIYPRPGFYVSASGSDSNFTNMAVYTWVKDSHGKFVSTYPTFGCFPTYPMYYEKSSRRERIADQNKCITPVGDDELTEQLSLLSLL